MPLAIENFDHQHKQVDGFPIGLCQQHMKDKRPKTFHLSRSLKPFLDNEFNMTLQKRFKTSRFKAML
jgi:hypothetical protein